MKKVNRSAQGVMLFIALGVFCLSQSPIAFAEHGPARGGREVHFGGPASPRDFPRHYYHRELPLGYAMIRLADAIYYYSDGIYYRNTPSGYVVVQAPVGATVSVIPAGYRTIVYNDVTYYTYDRTYYQQEPQGYRVVTPPPAAAAKNSAAVEAPEKTIVVNVPNPNGSYIPITLQKYSDGYQGPKGEYYPDYPTLEQLKAMYSIAASEAAAPQVPEELVVDVPNANGSYVKVKLVKSQDGYVGPEGEFYPKKPTVEQLKQMYAKG